MPSMVDIRGPVYLWGAGSTADMFIKSYYDFEFDGVIETKPKNNTFNGLDVYSPEQVDIKNATLIIASEFKQDIICSALEYGANQEMIIPYENICIEDADCTVISYQKCGRTWLRLMLGRIFQQVAGLPEKEVMGITESGRKYKARNPEIPWLFFYHDDDAHRKTAEQMLHDKSPYRGKSLIFLCRDPRDVVVSNYYHMTYRAKLNNLNIQEFVERYYPGIVEFYNIWAKNADSGSIFVRYEDAKENAERELKRIMRYLGVVHLIDDAVIKEAVEYCHIDNMKLYEKDNRFDSCLLSNRSNDDRSAKVRSGSVGGFREELDEKTQEWCDELLLRLDPGFKYFP